MLFSQESMAEIIIALETLEPEWGKNHFCMILLAEAENSVQNSDKKSVYFLEPALITQVAIKDLTTVWRQ